MKRISVFLIGVLLVTVLVSPVLGSRFRIRPSSNSHRVEGSLANGETVSLRIAVNASVK